MGSKLAALKKTLNFSAKESLKRFREIESETGIEFYSEVGFLTAGSQSNLTQKDLAEKEALAEAIRSEGSDIQKVELL